MFDYGCNPWAYCTSRERFKNDHYHYLATKDILISMRLLIRLLESCSLWKTLMIYSVTYQWFITDCEGISGNKEKNENEIQQRSLTKLNPWTLSFMVKEYTRMPQVLQRKRGKDIFLICSSDMKSKYKRVICLTWTSNSLKWTSIVFIGQCVGTLPIFLHARDWMEQETVTPPPTYELVKDLRPLHQQHQITEWKVQRSYVYTVYAVRMLIEKKEETEREGDVN